MAERKSKLTQEDRIFCQSLILGKTQKEAYRIAFPQRAAVQTETGIAIAASRTANKKHVIEHLNEIRSIDKIATERGIWTRENRLEMLEDIAKTAYEIGTTEKDMAALKTSVQAIEAAAKIAMDYSTKIDVDVSHVSYSFNVLTDLAKRIDQQVIEGQTINSIAEHGIENNS